MSLFNKNDINSVKLPRYKSSKEILIEGFESFSTTNDYDIFLSHSFDDKEYIIKIKILLEDYGYKTYVDWIEDKHLDRGRVTKETAETIKTRMKACKCLLFATSDHSPYSRWMPWELGFFDGFRKKVAILPIAEGSETNYQGQEYLGIYPYIEKYAAKQLQVTYSTTKKIFFDNWLQGYLP